MIKRGGLFAESAGNHSAVHSPAFRAVRHKEGNRESSLDPRVIALSIAAIRIVCKRFIGTADLALIDTCFRAFAVESLFANMVEA